MADRYLTEAFQSLKELSEDVFDLSADGITALNDLVKDNENNDGEIENIIDPVATTEEELQDSYIGKVILDCSICQSKIYKDPSEVTISEDGELANVGEECPYCQSSDGYKIIGEVAPYSETDVDVDVTKKGDEETANIDISDDENLDESCKNNKDCEDCKDCKDKEEKDINEDLQNVNIETDNETINITATKKSDDGSEMIAPITPDTEAEINKEEPEGDTYQDIDMSEFDENDFDDLGESYLKRVYENVRSYKTVSGSVKGNLLKLEGIITFKSGKRAKTNFVFEASTITKRGKLKFLGENKQFARNKNAFTLTGRMKGKKFIAESLTYSYRARDGKTGASKRLYGTVRK